MRSLREDLREALNSHSRENQSNTPDFILAEFLIRCLEAFDNAVNDRDKWYGIKPEPGGWPQLTKEEVCSEIKNLRR